MRVADASHACRNKISRRSLKDTGLFSGDHAISSDDVVAECVFSTGFCTSLVTSNNSVRSQTVSAGGYECTTAGAYQSALAASISLTNVFCICLHSRRRWRPVLLEHDLHVRHGARRLAPSAESAGQGAASCDLARATVGNSLACFFKCITCCAVQSVPFDGAVPAQARRLWWSIQGMNFFLVFAPSVR